MDQDNARLVLNVITACGGVVWFVALAFVRRTARLGDDAAGSTGEVVVPGDPRELAQRATQALAQGARGTPLQLAAIVESRDGRVRWESRVPTLRHEGELRFAAQGSGNTKIEYAVRRPRRRGLLLAARIVHAVGFGVLVALYLVLDRFVVGNPEPAVRAQAFQMVQCIHVLWPPFLFAGLDRGVGRTLVRAVETLARNLAYVGVPDEAARPRG